MSDFDEINRRFQEAMHQAMVPDTERAITKVLIQVEGRMMPMVPIATSTLANSVYRYVRRQGDTWRGDLGFGAEYAQRVHDASGALMGTNTPRNPARLGVVWGPSGEPGFLKKAIEQSIPDLPELVAGEYRE